MILSSMKGSQILSVYVKEMDRQIFFIGHELQDASLPKHLGHMFYNVKAFIALFGGLEKLDRISSITYCAKLNFHKKSLGLLNVNGLYNGLLYFLDHVMEKGFLSQVTYHTIMSTLTTDQLINKLQTYAPKLDPLVK